MTSRTTCTRALGLTLLLAPAAVGMVACAGSDGPSVTASVGEDHVTVPAEALTYAAEVDAGTTCGAVNTDLIIGTIAATTRYDSDYHGDDGGKGWSGLAPEPWARYGTADATERADGRAATTAVAHKLCDAYRFAADLADRDASVSVDDLALSTYLVGARYTEQYGVVDEDAEWDPHQVREKITEIQDATASVRQDI